MSVDVTDFAGLDAKVRVISVEHGHDDGFIFGCCGSMAFPGVCSDSPLEYKLAVLEVFVPRSKLRLVGDRVRTRQRGPVQSLESERHAPLDFLDIRTDACRMYSDVLCINQT